MHLIFKHWILGLKVITEVTEGLQRNLQGVEDLPEDIQNVGAIFVDLVSILRYVLRGRNRLIRPPSWTVYIRRICRRK